ncbi:MAG TPA: hypothetical protein VFB58_07620 [Chloroflexota bacterium]|nr:hypothetical protein [Chloroflexota bacterium]
MRTLLWFLGIAAIVMGIAGTVALHPSVAYFGLMGLGVISIGLGFRSPEEI